MTAIAERNIQPDTLADERWQAIQDHDPAYETAFTFGVKTTGVYCRTTCRGAPVLRKNIEFFDEITEARAAGYRPCKRCRPDEGGPHSRAVAAVTQACELIDATPDELLTVAALARHIGVTDHALRRSFDMILGITPRQYAEQRRLERFKDDVRNGHDVTSALYESGYSSPSRLYESSGAHLGMTPGQYRKGGVGISINYAIVDSPLGRLLVAGTDKGVCRISIADNDESLVLALRKEFPAGRAIEGRRPPQRMDPNRCPRRCRRTVRHRHWTASRCTRYSLPAPRVGSAPPHSARRNSNLLTDRRGYRPTDCNACRRQRLRQEPHSRRRPLHRVVRSDGALGGYALGPARKQQLLHQEGARE